ncbi:RnfH family protein [Kangiella sp. TOML190]|uniref:RnfH family protein n=1 Tax=Kangiella sp. TOML190 TaxID=2931351 RepID=UPI00203CE537|nr:RnfH family protein [Kangiella sp. TOML190]
MSEQIPMTDNSDKTSNLKVTNIKVEVAYALPDKQTLLTTQATSEDTIEQVIKTSGILEICPEIDLTTSRVGIFSKLAKLSDTLHDGDRIEIYRPLIIDPKEVRKQRALKAKENKNK